MTQFSSIVIGHESLAQQCADQLLNSGHAITAVVTRHTGFARWARELGLTVEAPGRDLAARLGGARCDWILSIANLDILPPDVLALARRGAVNFHDGPLPRHAGLNAPCWAKIENESEHGITWHLIGAEIDAGDIVVQRRFPLQPTDTALTLNTKCYEAGLESFSDLVSELERDLPSSYPQDLSQRSYHSALDRPGANGSIDFQRSADEVARLVRALDHRPYWNPLCTAKILTETGVVNVFSVECVPSSAVPGTVLEVTGDSVTIACRGGAVRLSDLRDENGVALNPKSAFEPGAQLPEIGEGVRREISEEMRKAARHDGFWRERLAGFNPCRLPFLSETSGPVLTRAVSVSPDVAARALSAVVSGMAAKDRVHIAFSHGDHRFPASERFLLPWVALETRKEADANAVAGEVDICAARGPIAADLLLRDAELKDVRVPDVGLSCAAGHIEGTALTVEVKEAGVTVHYDSGRMSDGFVSIIIARLKWVADQIGRSVEAPNFDMLPPSEKDLVLAGFNQTQTSLSDIATIHEAFEQMVALRPDDTALIFEDMTLTYAQVNAQANRLAHILRQKGVRADSIVGLHCPRGAKLVVGALGILKAGGAYLPLDPDYPQDRLQHYLTDSAANVVVTHSSLRDALPETRAKIVEIDTDPALDSAPESNPEAIASRADLAYMIYTSGSTGTPKGVMVEHRNVLNFFAGMDPVVPHEPPGTWVAVTSLSFDISVLELFYALARGFRVVLPSLTTRGVVSGGVPVSNGTGMKFSIYYWGNDDGVGSNKYRLLLEGAKFADDNGFCAVWTPERHFHAFGGPYPNPAVTGAAVAAVTRNIGVRSGSCVAPLHHPARIAEEWAVIDNLTNGRAGLAMASGWQPDDFVLRPENTPPNNKPAMFDYIEKVRQLWRGEPVAFQRKDGSLHSVVTQPRPVTRELPIWVTTAGNPETWREAGKIGANVLTHLLGQSIAEVKDKIAIYHEALREAGHDPADFDVSLMLHTCVADTREEAREIAREPMKDYLRSAAGLIKQYAWAFPAFKKPKGVKNPFELDLGTLSEEELEGILDFAFERYFNDSGLFGTVQDALSRVRELHEIGVTEVACLIDYGIEADRVLEGLKPLAEVVRRSARKSVPEDGDYSIAAMIERHHATHLQCTPSMMRIIVADDHAREALANLQHIFLGGEALPGALVGEIHQLTQATITNMYGPTETTIWSSTANAEPVPGTVDIGAPIANTQLYVLDEQQQPLGVGVAGELWIGGEGVTRGYWRREELTAERFVPDPFNGGRMYRTGDLVRRRPDGRLEFIGRVDSQVKLRGYRIELGEIEAKLESLPGVEQAVVVVSGTPTGDAALTAFVRGPDTLSARDIRAGLGGLLPDYMVPATVVQVDAFPLTPNKKVDRNALLDQPIPQVKPAMEAEDVGKGIPNEPMKAPVAGAQWREDIARIWAEVLGVDTIGSDDNFFDLGGHSLLAVQTHREIRDRLGVTAMSITDIFQFPTLGALCDRIERLGGGSKAATSGQVREMPSQSAPEPRDRAQQRSQAMARRRAMRARRSA